MEKIAFITDSGCGHNIDDMHKEGIYSLPLQIGIANKNYFDLENIQSVDVIRALKKGDDLATSLPSLGLIDQLFVSLKENGYKEAVAVPICPGLSGTMNALYLAADQNDINLHCIDCGVTAVVQKYLIEYLKDLIEVKGLTIKEAMEKAEEVVTSTNTLLVPSDMMHLTKSGRLSKTSATIAEFLMIKPILEVNKQTAGKIEVINKKRTFKKALSKALEIMAKEIGDFDDYIIAVAHVDAYGDAMIFADDLRKSFPSARIEIIPLCNPVAIHTGLGCIAVQYFRNLGAINFKIWWWHEKKWWIKRSRWKKS